MKFGWLIPSIVVMAAAIFGCADAKTSRDREISADSIAGDVRIAVGRNGDLQYFFVPQSHSNFYALEASPKYRSVKESVVEDILKEKVFKTNELVRISPKSVDVFYYLPNNELNSPSGKALTSTLEPGWKATKVDFKDLAQSFSGIIESGSKLIPVPRDEFMRDFGEKMLKLAEQTACNQRIIPESFSIKARLSAGLGIVVEGKGEIEFQATWRTSELCRR